MNQIKTFAYESNIFLNFKFCIIYIEYINEHID